MTDFAKIIQEVEHEFGAGALWLGDDVRSQNIPAIPTGSLRLDQATGIGGIPRGRISEIYGPESSGKSTLSIHLMAEAQQLDIAAAYIDAEQALDPGYARRCGLDLSRLLVSQPDSAEQALNITERLTRSGEIGLVVVDSVAAMVPRDEIEKDIGEVTVALQARLMSSALRKLNPLVNQHHTALVFINQLRDKISGLSYGGERSTTPGGRALKFYSSLRIELRQSHAVKHREQVIGNEVRARIRKNKVAPPFQAADFAIIYNEGISQELELIAVGLDHGILTKKGSYHYYQGAALGNGQEQTRLYLKEHPEIAADLRRSLSADAAAALPEPAPPLL